MAWVVEANIRSVKVKVGGFRPGEFLKRENEKQKVVVALRVEDAEKS